MKKQKLSSYPSTMAPRSLRSGRTDQEKETSLFSYKKICRLMSIVILCICSSLAHSFSQTSFTLMLDPAGDAQYPGRIIEDSFERGITLQCVEELQRVITQRFPKVRVVLTRFPGETRQPLQNANFANRLDVDLYISIHCYPESKPKSQLYLYYFSHNDTFLGQPAPYSFCAYDKAHLFSIKSTKAWGATMERILRSAQYGTLFVFHGLYTIPFAPLIGIKKPAIAFEIGLKQKESWKQFIEPIVASLTPLIERTV